MPSTVRRFRTPTLAAAAALVALGVGALSAGPTAATPTSNLVFSVDGGTTWSANVNAAPGQTVIAREYYDNDSSANIAGASVTTTLPTGFSLVAGTTEVCLNPGTTDPTNPTSELACNTDAGQGGAIDEAAVWSGESLAISPTAGLLTQSTSATSGILQVGEFKYLNLDQCVYFGGTAQDAMTYATTSPNSPTWEAGTTASNTAQASPSCGPGAGNYPFQALNSGVANIPLLGQRYFNLDQCSYYGTSLDQVTYIVPVTPHSPDFSAATGASNAQPASQSCGAGAAGYLSQPGNSGIDNVDLLGNTVLNLNQCMYYGAPQDAMAYFVPSTPNSPTWRAGTTASNTAQASPSCGPGAGNYPLQAGLNSGTSNVNLIDTTRGQGFVQWSMTAPTPGTTTTYTEDGQLTGTGTGDPTTSGTITIDASVGTPLANPWVIGGAIGGVALVTAAIVYARRRAVAS